MCKTSLHVQISSFRSHRLVWVVLAILTWSWLPLMSLAQQPTATISVLSGTVLVNGQEKGKDTVLNAGDVLETQAGASVVLELSDGSLLELGENTKLDIAELSQTATGARVSRLKLLWGRIRANLSAGHQQEGSTFDIETPNALVGVKFSEPDIEVSYNLEEAETVGIAHTVELIAINLLTNEKIVVPVGSSVIIAGVILKIIAGTTAAAIAAESGTAAAGTSAAETTTAATTGGLSTGTKIAIGAGTVAAVGGVAAIAANSGNGGKNGGIDENNPFTGTFRLEGNYEDDTSEPNEGCESNGIYYSCIVHFVITITLTQNGTLLTGTLVQTNTVNCCTVSYDVPLWGTVDGTIATFTGPAVQYGCEGENCSYKGDEDAETLTATLVDNGRILRVYTDPDEFVDCYRQ